MPDTYSGFSLYAPFFVNDDKQRPVAARYLTGSQGNFVMNPNKPGVPYIVPLDYRPQAVIDAYRSSWNRAFSQAAHLVSQDDDMALTVALAAARGKIYRDLTNDFSTGGAQDLQRSYNGTTGNINVRDFTDAASLNLGLAAAAGNVTGLEVAIGGGLLNLYKGAVKKENVTLGPVFGLRPGNYSDIMTGVRLHGEGAFEEPDNPSQAGAAPGSLREYYPGAASDYAFQTASIPGVANPTVGASADQNALAQFASVNRNALRW